MTDNVVMSGGCTILPDVLVLHSYDNIGEEILGEPQSLWTKTKYYMTVSDSGVTRLYHSETGEEVSDEIKREIGTQIGCTMRFRQG